MNIKTVLTLSVVIFAASIIAQSSTYAPGEAAKHVGETATITGTVDGVHQSGKGNIFLNMGGKYPNQAFAAFIPSSNSAQFSNPQHEGRTVAVGKITLYMGKPKSSSIRPRRLARSKWRIGDHGFDPFFQHRVHISSVARWRNRVALTSPLCNQHRFILITVCMSRLV